MLPSVRAQGASRFASKAQQGAAALEDFDRQSGPFEVRGQRFTVVLHMKRVVAQGAVVDPVFQETLAKLEIKDSGGAVHYEQEFPVAELERDSFVETTAATVKLLRGREGSGLLVTYGVAPSTPHLLPRPPNTSRLQTLSYNTPNVRCG